MSCDLQRSRKEYIEKDLPLKQFDIEDDIYSVDYIDYDEIYQNGLETADQSFQIDNLNNYSIDTHEKIAFLYPPHLKKPSCLQNSRNIAIAQKLSFEKEGLLLHKKQYVYCLVENKQFNVYTSKEQKKIILTIRFDIFPSQIQLIYNSKGQVQFMRFKILCSSPQVYDFYHNDSSELQNWFKDINYQILSCEPKLKIIPQYQLISNYSEKIHINEDDFLREADSLDLVFFQGKSFGSQITRVVCQSDYDHVALILRGHNDKIFFFEAGQNNGVTLYTWEKFKNYNWRDYYKQVVFRKLHCTRTIQMIDTLEKFVKSAAGRNYELSFSKLFKKKSFVNQAEAEEGRTYFCSELIAAAYKRVGLLPSDISSTQYWPGNFSEQGQIQLQLKDSYLSNEKVIYV